MGKRLYIGNLSYDTTDETLNAKFAEFGELESATVVSDRMTGRSRGFGFVEYANDEDGQKAIDAMDGQDFEGRDLKVNEARPREERAPRDDNGGGGYDGGGGGGNW